MGFASQLLVFDICALLDGVADVQANTGAPAYRFALAKDDPAINVLDSELVALGLYERLGYILAEILGQDVY
ncbi:MAG: hypothetical protein LPJ92_12020 [Rhodobacterales bacterium]|nr:hypothetical protein [Rhodobacterales bacterium]MDX5391062.1 hypothetical protein [Rhodobacterales bacterium]MDX5490757.1 hypothetical protein [Rhodobacterales bacterium]